MNDYYGGFMMSPENVKKTLLVFFQRPENGGHSVALIQEIIEELRATAQGDVTYSVTGWRMYGFANATHSIKESIHERKLKGEQKLAFMRGVSETTETNDTIPCDDIMQMVASYM